MSSSAKKNLAMEILPLSLDERMAILREQSWFAESYWHELGEVVRSLLVYYAPEGARICREGHDETYLFLLVKGEVHVRKKRADSDGENTLAVLTSGQTFGEMSLIDGGPRDASVDARTDCTLFVLTRDTFMHLIEDKPEVATRLLLRVAADMSRRLRVMNVAFVSGTMLDEDSEVMDLS